MQRNIDLDEISDKKLYSLNDLVKADCRDCSGCSACCQGMGSSILLDPLDIHRISTGLHLTFEQLLEHQIELNVSDSIILPNLKMSGPAEQCAFLDEERRCSIHSVRPGICRLFPLGRICTDRSFHYFLQIYECRKENRSKIKVKKWIDTPNPKAYEAFICDWHYFLIDLQRTLVPSGQGPEPGLSRQKAVSLSVLQSFYTAPYLSDSFYPEFYERLASARSRLFNDE